MGFPLDLQHNLKGESDFRKTQISALLKDKRDGSTRREARDWMAPKKESWEAHLGGASPVPCHRAE